MTQVRTENGMVEGLVEDGLHIFRAIPYAAPPFGARRFLPPQPAEPWDGVRDATRQGVSAPQPLPKPGDVWAEVTHPGQIGEDCLTLEIWTPDPGAAGLPVMVHIHGGGYVTGSGSAKMYNGRAFARDGVVHVGINYRLGIDGFVWFGEGHDNLGLRDQVAALEWVQRNIRAFGGDPDNVTIFGQSGGGVSVMFQTVIPSARGLFKRAIAQSGSSVASTDAETSRKVGVQAAKLLKVEPTVDGLRNVSLERTAKASEGLVLRFALNLLRGNPRGLIISPFQAVHETEFLPLSPLDAAKAGQPAVPLLTGTARHEVVGFVEVLTAVPVIGRLAVRGLRKALALPEAMQRAYATGPRRLSDRAALVEAQWSDWAFRIPTIHLIEHRLDPSWLYEFRWQAKDFRLGSMHGIEIPFTRDLLPMTRTLSGDAGELFRGAPQELADAMHSAWVRFATTGDPGWEPYTPERRATMVFDIESRVVADAAGVEREVWAGRW